MIEKLKELAKSYDETVKTIKDLDKTKKNLIAKIVELTGNKNVKTDFISVAIIPESIVKKVDVEMLKTAGIYEKYSKESTRKQSIRITTKF